MRDTVQLVERAAASPASSATVAILGGSGFTGGELLRLLLQHPGADLVGATSGKLAGQPLHRTHPNLRGFTDLKFLPRDGLPDADVVFSCLPHQASAQAVAALHDQGTRVIDLSADFRLRDGAAYQQWYGSKHPRPDLLEGAVYGLPEAHRDEIRAAGRGRAAGGNRGGGNGDADGTDSGVRGGAHGAAGGGGNLAAGGGANLASSGSVDGAAIVSGVGCVATSMNLALLPLADAGLLHNARVVVDAKIGSSAAGTDVNEAGMHAHRSRSMRLYAPTGHRHAAEVQQECGVLPEVSVHSTELVRGVLATCHILLDGEAPAEVELWKAYRARYQDEPFVRIVKERQGVHRGPDAKLVLGSNVADVGFHAADGPDGRGRIVATCALDNLVKGAAGSAVQCFNLMTGQPETTGLMQIPVGPQ